MNCWNRQHGTGRTQHLADRADRPTEVSYPTGHLLTYLLDGAGNRQGLLDRAQRTTYTWDGLHRVAGSSTPSGSGRRSPTTR